MHHAPRFLAACAALLAALLPPKALAVDTSWSGFATLGYAQSDSPYTYQRFISDEGSFKRDTLLAGQLDLRLNPQWSATVQAQVAPNADREQGWSLRTSWAFVAWRPDNDWLVRVGKARVPLYLYSESLDVGVASDMARMPHEMYSIAPTNDFTGVYVTRTLMLGEREITVDAYAGATDTQARLWLRDGAPPTVAPGPMFKPVHVKIRGLAVTSRDASLTWRLGVTSARTNAMSGGLPVRYPRVDIAPGLGYWKVDASMPGPDIETLPYFRNLIVTAGAEWSFGDGWRVAGEVVNMRQFGAELGSDSKAGYLALFKRIGSFTPYVSVARQRSSDVVLGWHQRLTTELLPAAMPGAQQINAAQRIAGETGYAFDQRSRAVGLSYALSPTAKLKGEWMETHVGQASGHFDVPQGMPDAQGLRVRTVSVNLSVAF